MSSRSAAPSVPKRKETTASCFEEKMKRLTATLHEQMVEGRKLAAAIEPNRKEVGLAR